MKKMIWTKPQMHEVQFEANEYVSVCVTSNSILSSFTPDIDKEIWKSILDKGNSNSVKLSDLMFEYEGITERIGGDSLLTSESIANAMQGDTAYNSGTEHTLNAVWYTDNKENHNVTAAISNLNLLGKLFYTHDKQIFAASAFERSSDNWS